MTDDHPMWTQNLYRLANNRFEQIGMSWVKHTTWVGDSQCEACPSNPCISGASGLGPGCRDTYSADENSQQFPLGPRSRINPSTGALEGNPQGQCDASGSDGLLACRPRVPRADLNPVTYPDAKYFLEQQVIVAGELSQATRNNNVSYKSVTVDNTIPCDLQVRPCTGTECPDLYSLSVGSSTFCQEPAIRAWKAADPLSVVETDIDVPCEGRFILAAKAVSLGGGSYRYEYALYNMNSDRAARSFRVPLPDGLQPQNIGFHAVPYHSGEPYAQTPWTQTTTSTEIPWETETYTQNQNANALRWGTLYNFWFEANRAPLQDCTSTVTIDLFKPGNLLSVIAASVVPAPSGQPPNCNGNENPDPCDIATCAGNPACGDCNGNGVPDECDIANESTDANANGVPDECEPPPVVVWNADTSSTDRTSRSLRFRVDAAATAIGSCGQSAIKVTMIDLQNPVPPNLPQFPPPNFGTYESTTCTAAGETIPPTANGIGGCARWVGKPGTFLESQDSGVGGGNYKAARLQCTPLYRDWIADTHPVGSLGLIVVVGAEIAPSSQYSVQAYASTCTGSEAVCPDVSTPVTMYTRRSGDVVATFNPPGTTTQPDVNDITQVVNKLKNLPGALGKAITQLQPNLPELNADINGDGYVNSVDFAKFVPALTGPLGCNNAEPWEALA